MSRTSTPPQELNPQALAQVKQVVQRAAQGDASVLPELQQILNQHPDLWQSYGDLGHQAQTAWRHLIAGPDLMLRESLRRKQEALKAELAGAEPSPLERLLVERVVACWSQVEYADMLYAQHKRQGASPAESAEDAQRQTSAQHRYLTSIKALASVRKLLRPALSPWALASLPVPETPAGEVRGRRARACDPAVGLAVHN